MVRTGHTLVGVLVSGFHHFQESVYLALTIDYTKVGQNLMASIILF